MSNDIACRSNQQLIAGHFGHVGLCQLHTRLFYIQLTKAYITETSYNQLLIDSSCYIVISHDLLHTKLFYMQLMKAYVAKTSCNQLLIDSAASLLMISLPIANLG